MMMMTYHTSYNDLGDYSGKALRPINFCFLPAGFLLCLKFDPEGGGSMFFRNVIELLQGYTASHSSR
jgi:hypothetical protein